MADARRELENHEPQQFNRVQDLSAEEMEQVQGGRRVDDGCYLYYEYYCPSGELKPFNPQD